jgi:tetratricopeptide (TPR) repeat protein
MPLLGRILVVASLALSVIHVSAQTDAGWDALLSNHDDDAIRLFEQATSTDPKDWRAWLGLSSAHELIGHDSAAWSAMQRALAASPQSDQILYANLSDNVMTTALFRDASARQMLLDRIDRPDSLGILRAMACEQMGIHTLTTGDVDASTAWYRRTGAIHRWRLIGPFDNISGSGHDKVYPPEREDMPKAHYTGENGARVEWMDLQATRRDGWIDMTSYYASHTGIFYASTYVHSDKQRRVHARIGTSGSFRLFINGVEVHGTSDEHNNDLDTYISEVTLPKGWAHVLVKLGASDLDRCNFLLRFTDAAGMPIEMDVRTDPQPLGKADIRPLKIENPFVTQLRAALNARPDDVIMAMLLAKSLLRNDESVQAELVLRQQLLHHPDAVVLLLLMRNALLRSEKFDEAEAVVERITELRPDLQMSIAREIDRALESEQIDEAAELVDKLERVAPRSRIWYGYAMQIATLKSDLIRARTLLTDAYRDHPTIPLFASTAAGLAAIGPGRHAAAIEIMQRHLSQYYSETGLRTLAQHQLQAGDIDGWSRTYDELLRIVPAAPGFLSSMADVRAGREEYDEAVRLLQRALALAPTSSFLWSRLGSMQRSRNDRDGARQSYERALAFDPADFDAREALRQLSDLPSAFTALPTANVDSLIAVAPTSADMPDHSVVVLYNSRQRVVYSGSRSETRDELLIKILTIEGIDQFKEYRAFAGIPGALTFEKSVVRKSSGREVPADRAGGYLVFKTLEVGDVIHVRFRVRESNQGRLAPYFEEDAMLNQFVPVLQSSVHLIVPDDQPFKWRADNFSKEPSTRDTPFGKHYAWTLENEPAIESEVAMPDYSDVAKRLRISSIPSWSEIVAWYDEIARPKARSTFEITELMDSLVPPDAGLNEMEIIQRVYTYITTNVRYSSVPFRQSGLIPQKGRATLITRIGDCKDVATLCIAMLAERGIKAHIVLVDTELSPNAKEPLPTTRFDHAIARVITPKGSMYLDLTAPEIPLGCLPPSDVGAFALHIDQGVTSPLRLSASLFTPSTTMVEVDMHLSDDSARVRERITHTGSRTAMYRTSWKEMTAKDREKDMVEWLSTEHPGVTLHAMTLENLDAVSSSLSYTLEYAVPRYMISAGDFRIVKIPWYDDFLPDNALSYDKRQHAIERRMNLDTVRERIRIHLPEGFSPSGLDPEFRRMDPAATISVSTKINGRTLVIDRVNAYRSSFIQPSEYDRYRSFHNDVVAHDRQYLLLMPEGTTVTTPRKRK